MGKKADLAGRRFGRLVVLYETSERKDWKVVWHCCCDCGNEVDVIGSILISGRTISCGCYNRERIVERSTTHGMTRQGKFHPAYMVWNSMLQRCENQNDKRYKDYGGRGIKVCLEWHDPQVFVKWALANGWEKGLTLDRIDNDGNYEPNNCRWVTRKEQARNKRNNHLITFNGKTQSLAAWAEEAGVPYFTLYARISSHHWPIERALTTPVRGRKNAS